MTEDQKPHYEDAAAEQEHPHQETVDAAEAAHTDAPEDAGDELSLMKDKYLRLMADMENLRKRTAREVDDARKYTVSNFARELLNVQDNLERALEAMKAQQANPTAETLKTVVDGVGMVGQQLSAAFEKMHIRRIETTIGQKVDPERHQAMFEVPTNEHEHGTIVQEMQAGYTIGERLLRPALVGTAKRVQDEGNDNKPSQDGTNG